MMRDIATILLGYADDPMWPDHGDVPKVYLAEAAAALAAKDAEIARLKSGMPSDATQAEWMQKVGYRWLADHAPDRLTDAATRAEAAEIDAARLRAVLVEVGAVEIPGHGGSYTIAELFPDEFALAATPAKEPTP